MFTKKVFLCVAACLLIGVVSSAPAAITLDILTPGFEAGVAPGGWINYNPGDTLVEGWVWHPSYRGGQSIVHDGSNIVAWATFNYLEPQTSLLYQDLQYADTSPVLVAGGDTYTVSAQFMQPYGGNFGSVEVGIMDSVSETVLASQKYVGDAIGGPGSTPVDVTFNLTLPTSPVGVGNTARLYFTSVDIPDPEPNVQWTSGIDNVSVTLTSGEVPEPSTLVLLAAGLFGLLAYAWKKRR